MFPSVEFLVFHRSVDQVCTLFALLKEVGRVEFEFALWHAEKTGEHKSLPFFFKIFFGFNPLILFFFHSRIFWFPGSVDVVTNFFGDLIMNFLILRGNCFILVIGGPVAQKE